MKFSLPHETPQARRFWEYCGKGRLRLQSCSNCLNWRFPPSGACPDCGSQESEWKEVSGRARVISFVVYRHDFGTDLALPYVIALVELKEGPRMVTRLEECLPGEVRIGMAVELFFSDLPGFSHLPLYRPEPTDT